MQSKTENQVKRQVVINLQSGHWFLLGVIFTVIMGGGISACYQGRDIARFTGRPVRIELPEDIASYDDIIGISFHKNGNGETLKDVTYIGVDGLLHSKEYKDWGVFQGEIIWDLQKR